MRGPGRCGWGVRAGVWYNETSPVATHMSASTALAKVLDFLVHCVV